MKITKKVLKETTRRNFEIAKDFYTENEYNNLIVVKGVFPIEELNDNKLRISLSEVKKIDVKFLPGFENFINVVETKDGVELIVII